MTTISVPYHLDEHLPGLRLPPGSATVTADLPDGDVWERLGALHEAVAAEVARQASERPTVVSGDCTVSLGVVAGLQRAGVDPSVIWFDAHGDVQTLETTETGYLGGLPLRMLVGYRPDLVADRIGLNPIRQDHAVLVGARDIDRAEHAFLAAAGIRRSAVADVARVLPDGPLLLHIDLDVIDPSELPDMRVPARNGPTAEQVVRAAEEILATGRVSAVHLACTWQPEPAEAGPRLLERFLAALEATGTRGRN